MLIYKRCSCIALDTETKGSTLTTTSRTYTVQEAMDIRGMTKHDLAEASGLNLGTIERVLSDDPEELKTKIETAALIADALGLEIYEIEWPRGLSRVGRPPRSGCKITVTERITITRRIEVTLAPHVCPLCRYELPLTRMCGNCT